jgi:hypothetical protein
MKEDVGASLLEINKQVTKLAEKMSEVLASCKFSLSDEKAMETLHELKEFEAEENFNSYSPKEIYLIGKVLGRVEALLAVLAGAKRKQGGLGVENGKDKRGHISDHKI